MKNETALHPVISINDELQIPSLGLWLDARRPRRLSFISHAHSDHIGNHARVIVTEETAALCRPRLSRRADVRYESYPYGEPFSIGAATGELLPAGHILGSSQLKVHAEGETLVYTGDFKLRTGHTQPRCVVERCDTLVMECTYGRPHYRFPDRGLVEAELIARIRSALARSQTPVIYAYALGKAQEVVTVLTRAGLPVMVHAVIARICDTYRNFGVDLGEYKPYDQHTRSGHVVVVPPDARRSHMIKQIFPRCDIAVTGWAMDAGTRYRLGVDLALPYSDHADFTELIEYVERAQPKRVFCVHGFPDFAQHLRRCGVNANWLAPSQQLELFA